MGSPALVQSPAHVTQDPMLMTMMRLMQEMQKSRAPVPAAQASPRNSTLDQSTDQLVLPSIGLPSIGGRKTRNEQLMDVNTTGGFSIKVSSDDEDRPKFDFGADILADGNDNIQMKPKKKKKKKAKKQVMRQLSAIQEEENSPDKKESMNEFPPLTLQLPKAEESEKAVSEQPQNQFMPQQPTFQADIADELNSDAEIVPLPMKRKKKKKKVQKVPEFEEMEEFKFEGLELDV